MSHLIQRIPFVLCLLFFSIGTALTAWAQEITDYTALGQPDYAQRLGLSDEQIAQVAIVLDERLKALVAKPEARQAVFDAANAKLEALLTDAQKRMFAELVAGGKLRFNFRQETWPEVLDWFAGQAGLSLVMDLAPPGNFTYSDAKNYTPSEAIDLLNSVLQGKGFTLVRREQMLIVAPTTEGIPYDMVPRVTIEQLGERGRFEFVSVLFDLEGRPADLVTNEVQAFLGTHGRATPLAQTGQLLVVDTAGRVDAINKLIQSIPKPKPNSEPKPKETKPKPPEPVFQVHSAAGLNVNSAVETLKGLFGDAKFTADPRVEQITAFTIPARHQAIQQALAQMKANVTGEHEPRLEIYTVVDQDLNRLENVLAQAVPGIQISKDAEGERLLVVGDDKQQQTVRTTLQKMNAVVDESKNTVAVYDVTPELAGPLVELLKPLLPRASIVAQEGRIAVRGHVADQQIARSAIEQLEAAERQVERPALRFYDLTQRLDRRYLDTIGQLVPQANISEVTDGKKLAVVATRRDHERLSLALQQVQADLGQQQEKTLKFYPVTSKLRDRFEKLKANFEQQLAGVDIVWDYADDELAAHGTAQGHVALSQVLEELRQGADEAETQMHRFDVSVEDPNRLLSMLKRKFPNSEMMLNDAGDSLLAWTDKDQLKEVQQEFDRLAAVMPARREVELKIYAAGDLNLDELQALLQPVAKTAKFTADTQRKRLLAWATAEDHESIAATLATLQGSVNSDFKRVLIAYPIHRGDAATVVQMLQELRPDVRFAADARANQILVTAPLAEQSRLKAIIEQLDTEPGQGNEEVAQSYALKTLPPSTVIQLLQPTVPNMRLTPSDSQRQLAAVGSAFDHERLKKAIAQLDAEGQQGVVRSYDVGTADPRDVRNVLSQLAPRAIVSTNNDTRSVVVWADEADHAIIKQAVEQFTNQATERNRTLKSYPLPRGMGDTVLFVVRSVAPAATMDIDQSQGEMVVWGTTAEHAAVTGAMRDLAESKQQTLEVYELGGLPRDLAQDAIEEAFSHVEFIDSPDVTKLILLSPPEQHRRIKETVDRLIKTAPPTQEVVKIYPIDRNKAKVDTVFEALGEELRDRVSIQLDEDSNSLVVRGRDANHVELKAAIDAIVAQMPQIPRRETRVYPLEYADPDTAEYMLRDLLPQARFAEDRDTGTLAATAFVEEHEQIKSVIEQLDVPQRQLSRRTTEIYRFDQTDARSAEFAFERLAPSARVTTIRGSNSVMATGTEADHKLFREIAEKLNGGAIASIVKVYPLDKERIDAEDVVDSIDPTLRSRVSIRTNEAMNSVIVRGSPEDQDSIKQTIDGILTQVPTLQKRVTKVYRFQHGNARSARDVLRDMLDDASIVYDNNTETLAATATAKEQETIQAIVDQMDQPLISGKSTKIYRLGSASARRIYPAIAELVEDGRVSYDSTSNSLIVTTMDAEHTNVRQVIDDLNETLGGGAVTKVYALKTANPAAIQNAIEPLVPQAAISSDAASASLIVSADPKDHQRVQEIVAQLDQASGQQSVMKAYPIKSSDAKAVHQSLASAFSGNGEFSISFQEPTKTLFVVATPKNQDVFAELLRQLDQPETENVSSRIVKVYPLTDTLGEAARTAIDSLLENASPPASVELDTVGNNLIVVATMEQHEQAAAALVDMSKGETSTRVYAVKIADPNTIKSALTPLVPRASISSDPASGTLIVTGRAEDHAKVSEVMEKLDVESGQQTVMRAYTVRSADAKSVHQSLTATFAGNSNYSISFQEPTRTLFVMATPKNHAVFADLMKEIDNPQLSAASRSAKAYPLSNLSGDAARVAMTALLQSTSPAASVELDGLGNSLIVVGTAAQHQLVAGTLTQLAGADADLEVFDLEYVDPWTVESAVASLFEGQPAGTVPAVSSDYTSQRLFVRGTKQQIDQIRNLLQKMGETTIAMRSDDRGDVRTIPFRGDVNAAIEKIQQLWPRIRKNRIQVVAPSESDIPIDRQDDSSRIELKSDSKKPNSVRATKPGTETRFVAVQDAAPDEAAGPNAGAAGGNDVGADSPVVIVPNSDRITIASSDHAALDQLESLLRAMSRADADTSGFSSDFAVFLLRNTGASEMRQLLGDLFQQLRESGGTGIGTSTFGGGFPSFGPSFGDVAVVADDRLNALIIHGDRKERELIEELLRVLDSKDLPNPIIVFQPELVTLKNTQAERVLAILKNVYSSQLSSGGGRKKVDIPEGVSSEVASVLQQINAASAAPLLTLDIDEATNSIVMRAPPELRQEIKAFVDTLDSNASKNRHRNVRVIRIQQGKSDQMREALERFILQRD